MSKPTRTCLKGASRTKTSGVCKLVISARPKVDARMSWLFAMCTSCSDTLFSRGSPASEARTRPMPTWAPPASGLPAGGSTMTNGASGIADGE